MTMPDPSDPKPPRKFPPGNPELRKALDAFGKEHNLSREKLGVRLGINASYVSKYITGSNDFDAAPVDRKVADLLKTERLRSKEAIELFPTFVSRRIAGSLATITKTNDFGLIFSAAGLGKTSGVALELEEHPLSLAITASNGSADKGAIQSKIFEQIETKAWAGNTRKYDFIVEHLKDSGRLLMVDNGQRLHVGALQYLFDLHDATGVPVCILGNPEVEKVIRRNDQMFSRIGLKDEIALPSFDKAKATLRGDVEQVVDGLLARMVPAWAEELRPLALQTAWQRGHFRAVRKTVALAHQLSLNGGPLADACTAFRAAHEKLVRDFTLDQ